MRKVSLINGEVVISEEKKIPLNKQVFGDNPEIEVIRDELNKELHAIVKHVKQLKARAEEIQGILAELSTTGGQVKQSK